eukprot:gb/GFBE01014331.1/.p1 GENE.gb/GFBE01014331.1/~~gb/GFBE01014331.1/.p1  ORF type:complete len:267 (+),score=41.75 gb/GFBE01014331.1/:1-801(+)
MGDVLSCGFGSDAWSSGRLAVAVWNAASGAESKYKHGARKTDAAHEFADECAVVICPESDRDNTQAFRGEGYSTIKPIKGVQIFYWHQVLETAGSPRSIEMAGTGRKGTAVSQLFRHKTSGEHVLITGVHAGHYNHSSGLVNGTDRQGLQVAAEAMEQIRKLQYDMLSNYMADKVVIGGDFNELGDLIRADRERWMPLPKDTSGKPLLRHCRGSIHSTKTLKSCEVSADLIWVGGGSIDTSAVQDHKVRRCRTTKAKLMAATTSAC